YVKAHPDTFVFPTAFDIDNDVAQAFKVAATPTIVLLDAHGNIVLVHRGAGVLQNPHFREFLATMKG
ncbi:MAG: peroxiredoxin family protein, partial [Terriglobia bacterium]